MTLQGIIAGLAAGAIIGVGLGLLIHSTLEMSKLSKRGIYSNTGDLKKKSR